MADKKISAEAALSRIQSILRGTVSPSYVVKEAKSIKKIKPMKKAKGGKVKK
jgi:hypothetical protein